MSVTPNTSADDQSWRKSWAQYVQEAVAQALTRPPMAIHQTMANQVHSSGHFEVFPAANSTSVASTLPAFSLPTVPVTVPGSFSGYGTRYTWFAYLLSARPRPHANPSKVGERNSRRETY